MRTRTAQLCTSADKILFAIAALPPRHPSFYRFLFSVALEFCFGLFKAELSFVRTKICLKWGFPTVFVCSEEHCSNRSSLEVYRHSACSLLSLVSSAPVSLGVSVSLCFSLSLSASPCLPRCFGLYCHILSTLCCAVFRLPATCVCRSVSLCFLQPFFFPCLFNFWC